MTNVASIGVTTLYLLALINPISKVSILTSMSVEPLSVGFSKFTAQASAAAFAILLGAMVVGDWLLRSIFRVELYALQLAGGVVVFWMGLNALRHGVFFEHEPRLAMSQMALVPLACPMIAGPATIAACIGLPSQQGLMVSSVALLLALGVNHAVMLCSRVIGRALNHHNVLGALIRITGLIVMTIGTQMALDGLRTWATVVRAPSGLPGS